MAPRSAVLLLGVVDLKSYIWAKIWQRSDGFAHPSFLPWKLC